MSARIVQVAIAGDADQVLHLANSNPFIPNSSLVEPALLAACEYGQIAVVKTCLEDLKCNPNCVDESGRSPLHMAVSRRNGKVAVSILKLLIEKGAKIRKSVLHVCANEFAVFPLIDFGADVNARSVDGLPPISVAVSSDRQEVVAELVRAKCQVPSECLFLAKSGSVIQSLVRAGLDINARDLSGLTALQKAVNSNDKKLARSLLEAKADPSLVSRTPSVASCDEFDGSPEELSRSLSGGLKPSLALLLSKTNELSQLLLKLSLDESELAKSIDSDFVKVMSLNDAFSLQLKKVREMSVVSRKKFLQHNFCVICQCEPKSVVLMPCKHMCCCNVCANEILKKNSSQHPTCPICRTHVTEGVAVFT